MLVRYIGQQGAEAVGAEQGAGLVVVEAGGDGVVERRGPESGERAVADRDGLAGVDEVDPIHGQGREVAHDAGAQEGGDDPDLGVGGDEVADGADVIEVGVGEPDPAEVGGIDDRTQGLQELVALDDGAGVDQDGLLPVQDEGVDGTGPAGMGKADVRTSMPGAPVGGDTRCLCGRWSGLGVGARRGTGHRASRRWWWGRGRMREAGAQASASASAAALSRARVWRMCSMPQLLGPVGGDVDDAGPGGDPPHLVGLRHPRAARDRLELVAPVGRLTSAFVGDEEKSWPARR